MKKQLYLMAFFVFLLVGCDRAQKPAPVVQLPPQKSTRYVVQLVIEPGRPEPIYYITDNEENKVYAYVPQKTGLALMRTVDLSKTGQDTIPYK